MTNLLGKLRKRKGNLARIKTTLTVKKATKHRLQDLAAKGESYDQVINGLINRNRALEIKNRSLTSIVHENKLERNLLEQSTKKRGIAGITLEDETVIQFNYVQPDENIPTELYEMDIQIEKIFSGKQVFTDLEELNYDPQSKALIRLLLVEKVIILHFIKAFWIPNPGLAFDYKYWQGVWNRSGLSGHSFDRDIMEILSKYEDEMYE